MNIKTRSNLILDNILRIEDREEEQDLIIQHMKALNRIDYNRLSSNRLKGRYRAVHTSRHQFLPKPLHQVGYQDIRNQISPFNIVRRRRFEQTSNNNNDKSSHITVIQNFFNKDRSLGFFDIHEKYILWNGDQQNFKPDSILPINERIKMRHTIQLSFSCMSCFNNHSERD